MLVDLTKDEVQEILHWLGDPEDHYGDPGHPAITAKKKLEEATDDGRGG